MIKQFYLLNSIHHKLSKLIDLKYWYVVLTIQLKISNLFKHCQMIKQFYF